MKSLFIYNNNISSNLVDDFKGKLGFAFPFTITNQALSNENYSFDSHVTDFLLEIIKPDVFDVIFLPFNLSEENYLELLGLQLAYHIRLTPLFCNTTTPIVFYGDEDAYQINKFSKLGGILFTKNVFITPKLKIEDLIKQVDFINKQENVFFDFNEDFLNRIQIKPSGNYETRHSIANEWAILRWANTLNLQSEEINKIESLIGSSLYYKYLKAIFPIQCEPNKAIFKISGTGRILYIDDEWNKGWEVVLEKFVSVSPDVVLKIFKYDFKDKTHEEILRECNIKVQNFNPDLVLLDLRLSDSEFSNNTNSKELTGYKVLQAIKAINPGIQVLIFTASNKVWHLLELQAAGANGFLLKESPELTINNKFSIESLQSLSEQITKCLSYAYLKEIWTLSEDIKKAFSKNPLTKKYFPRQLPEQLNGIKYQNLLLQELDAMYEILTTNNENKFNLSMIMLYKILEYLNEIFYQKVSKDKPPLFYDGLTVEYYDKNSKTWKKPTDKLSYFNKSTKLMEQTKINLDWLKSTSNKILNLAVKKLNLTDNSIFLDLMSLTEYRNDFIHSDTNKRSKLKVLDATDILKWTTSIASIIKNL